MSSPEAEVPDSGRIGNAARMDRRQHQSRRLWRGKSSSILGESKFPVDGKKENRELFLQRPLTFEEELNMSQSRLHSMDL